MNKRERLRELRAWATDRERRFRESRARVQPKAVVLEYRLNGQDWQEWIPVLPGETADSVARKKLREYSAVSTFVVKEVY